MISVEVTCSDKCLFMFMFVYYSLIPSQEHKDAKRLYDWKQATQGIGKSRCSDDIRAFLDTHMPGWNDSTRRSSALHSKHNNNNNNDNNNHDCLIAKLTTKAKTTSKPRETVAQFSSIQQQQQQHQQQHLLVSEDLGEGDIPNVSMVSLACVHTGSHVDNHSYSRSHRRSHNPSHNHLQHKHPGQGGQAGQAPTQIMPVPMSTQQQRPDLPSTLTPLATPTATATARTSSSAKIKTAGPSPVSATGRLCDGDSGLSHKDRDSNRDSVSLLKKRKQQKEEHPDVGVGVDTLWQRNDNDSDNGIDSGSGIHHGQTQQRQSKRQNKRQRGPVESLAVVRSPGQEAEASSGSSGSDWCDGSKQKKELIVLPVTVTGTEGEREGEGRQLEQQQLQGQQPQHTYADVRESQNQNQSQGEEEEEEEGSSNSCTESTSTGSTLAHPALSLTLGREQGAYANTSAEMFYTEETVAADTIEDEAKTRQESEWI